LEVHLQGVKSHGGIFNFGNAHAILFFLVMIPSGYEYHKEFKKIKIRWMRPLEWGSFRSKRP
jgi:hypothetical protein